MAANSARSTVGGVVLRRRPPLDDGAVACDHPAVDAELDDDRIEAVVVELELRSDARFQSVGTDSSSRASVGDSTVIERADVEDADPVDDRCAGGWISGRVRARP